MMLDRLKYLKVFLKDHDKKKSLKVLKERMHYGVIKRVLPTDYFRKFFYRTNVIEYKNYLSLKEYYAIINSKPTEAHIKSIIAISESLNTYTYIRKNHH